MDISQHGIDMIVEFEGKTEGRLADGRYKAYLDTIAKPPVWTIYCGLTKGVHEGMIITEEQGEAMYRKELNVYEDGIDKAVEGVQLSQNQFDACVSFTYNCGVGAFQKSIAPLIRAGKFDQVPAMMKRYCHCGAKVINGLVRRRAAEALLFMTPEPEPHVEDAPREPMPQRVEEAVVPTTKALKIAASESKSFWGAVVSLPIMGYQLLQNGWAWAFDTAKEVGKEALTAKDSLSGWDALFSYLGANTKAIFAAIVVGALIMVLVRSIARRK